MKLKLLILLSIIWTGLGTPLSVVAIYKDNILAAIIIYLAMFASLYLMQKAREE